MQAQSPDGAQGITDRPQCIHYDPGLIDTLLSDHAQLRYLFAAIHTAARTDNFASSDTRALLIDFKSRLQAHVLTENMRFYDYLYQQVAGKPHIDRMVHVFHAEMNDIERQVIAFVRKHQSHDFSVQEQLAFASDYVIMGKLLEHRLSTEEDSLYRLYRQS